MFEQFATQMQNSMKPMNDLMALSNKMFEQLAQQQSTFMTAMVNDGMAFAGSVSGQSDATVLMDGQKTYVAGVQGKMAAATQDTYSVLAEAQTQASEIFTSAVAQVAATAPVAKAAPVAAKPAVKTAK